MTDPKSDKFIKKVRRRRSHDVGLFHVLVPLLLLPILLLPGGSTNVVDSAYEIPVEHWPGTRYASKVEKPIMDSALEMEKPGVAGIEVMAPASPRPLNIPPIEDDPMPPEIAQTADAIPLDRALWPHIPLPHTPVVIGSRRSTGRGAGVCSTTSVTITTTTTASAPVPEPDSWMLLVSAWLGAALRRRRRRPLDL